MSVFNENLSIKIKEVLNMSIGACNAKVAPRPYSALALRIKGTALFKTADSEVVSNTGDLFFMPAGCEYNALYKNDNRIIVVHFYSDLSADMENHTLKNTEHISLIFSEMLKIWNEKPEGYYYKTLSMFCEAANAVLANDSLFINDEIKNCFNKSLMYIEENFLSPSFSIEKAVFESKMSDTYFRKLFLMKFGMPPKKYVTLKRLSYAEILLSSGKHSISEVAKRSGFSDVKYFSRLVKKVYNSPPSKLYRHNTKH